MNADRHPGFHYGTITVISFDAGPVPSALTP